MAASKRTINAFVNNVNKVLQEIQSTTIEQMENYLKQDMEDKDDGELISEFFVSFRELIIPSKVEKKISSAYSTDTRNSLSTW